LRLYKEALAGFHKCGISRIQHRILFNKQRVVEIFDEKNAKAQTSFLFLQAKPNKILYIAALFLTPAYRERHD